MNLLTKQHSLQIIIIVNNDDNKLYNIKNIISIIIIIIVQWFKVFAGSISREKPSRLLPVACAKRVRSGILGVSICALLCKVGKGRPRCRSAYHILHGCALSCFSCCIESFVLDLLVANFWVSQAAPRMYLKQIYIRIFSNCLIARIHRLSHPCTQTQTL